MNEHSFHQQLDAYLDGLLPAAERAAFEQAMRSDEALRAKVDRQRAIDESLRRLFAHADFDAAARASANGRGAWPATGGLPARAALTRRLRPVLLAASLALVAGVSWLGWSWWRAAHPPTLAVGVARSADELYRAQVAAGFKPDWKCETDEQFADAVRKRFGRALLVAPSADVAVLGWGRANSVISPGSALLLIRDKGEPAIVIVDDVRRDRAPALDPSSGLRMQRREVNGVVLYEVSPRADAAALALFYDPEAGPPGGAK